MWDFDYFYMLADSAAMADQYGNKFALCNTLAAMGSNPTDATKMETFANFTNTFWGPDFGSGCFYDSACLADKTQYEAGATDRSWRWQKCYQLAYFQPAPVEGSLRSSVVTMDYHYEQCMKVFGLAPPDVSAINDQFGADKIEVDKVFFSDFSDGERVGPAAGVRVGVRGRSPHHSPSPPSAPSPPSLTPHSPLITPHHPHHHQTRGARPAWCPTTTSPPRLSSTSWSVMSVVTAWTSRLRPTLSQPPSPRSVRRSRSS